MTINADPNKYELLITAWLDNEISAEQRKTVEHLLATDPLFKSTFEQRKLEYANLDAALRRIDKTPMPENVMALLQGEDAAPDVKTQNTAQHADLSSNNSNASNNNAESKWFTPLSLAASVVMVGLLVLFYIDSGEMFEGSPDFRAQLHNALSNSLSGDTIPLTKTQKIYINLTFLDKEYRYCREYFISQPEQPTLHRIACRTHSQWKTEVEAETKNSPLDSSVNQIRTASGNISNDIDAFLDDEMVTDALEHEDEISAIKKIWQLLPEK